MNKFKKNIILLISFILAFVNNNSFINAEAKDVDINKTTSGEVKDMKLAKLFSSPDWKTLVQGWKELNKYSKSDSFDIQNYTKLKSCVDKSDASIKALRAQGLLTKPQLEFLNKILNDRIAFVKYKSGVIECYEMSSTLAEIVKTREDMEKRYELLQQLYKENKINTDTFNQTKDQIVQDLQSIDKKSEKPPGNYNDSPFIDLLMNLNN